MSKAYKSSVWMSHAEPTGWRVSLDVGEFIAFDGAPAVKRGPLVLTDTTGWRESKAAALIDAAAVLEEKVRQITAQAAQVREQAWQEVQA